MNKMELKQSINLIKNQRESLVKLLEQPDLGELRIDVVQALEELDELIEEFNTTFALNNDQTAS
jgi:hypothetical protein